MVPGVTKNSSIYLRLGVFQILNFVDFGAQILLANEVHHVSFILFWLNNVRMKSLSTFIKNVLVNLQYLQCNKVYMNIPCINMTKIGNLP